jgi:hypothetical protein
MIHNTVNMPSTNSIKIDHRLAGIFPEERSNEKYTAPSATRNNNITNIYTNQYLDIKSDILIIKCVRGGISKPDSTKPTTNLGAMNTARTNQKRGINAWGIIVRIVDLIILLKSLSIEYLHHCVIIYRSIMDSRPYQSYPFLLFCYLV